MGVFVYIHGMGIQHTLTYRRHRRHDAPHMPVHPVLLARPVRVQRLRPPTADDGQDEQEQEQERGGR